MKTNTKILLAGIALLSIFALLSTRYMGREEKQELVIEPQNQGTSTSEGAYTVQTGTSTPQKPSTPAPVLVRAIPATSPDLDVVGRTRAIADLNEAIENLKKDPYSYQDWVYLGLLRQMLSDYAGAELAWEYATKLAPGQEVAFANLGNLYMLYIKDGAKSESNYRKAISINPKNTNNYRSLLELYTYFYKKGTSAGENILKEGMQKNPGSYDLGVLLARLYLEQGRNAEARTAFSSAADMAQAAGKTDVAASIRAEGASVK